MKHSFLFLPFLIYLLISCTEPTNPPDNGPDTTSHDFSWTLDTIGTNYSMLRDVAVINENDIWAVGEIHIEGEQDIYNAVHWNGCEWTRKRIPAVTYWGSISQGPLNCIFAFASDDIWGFSKAGSYVHWDGNNWSSEYISERKGGIYKIWGTSSENLYFVGNNGNITHYDGQNWQRIESGTDIDLQDIWGDTNPETGEFEVYAIASYRNYGRGMELLKIEDNNVTSIDTTGLHINLSGIWFSSGKAYYITGNGVFTKEESIGKSIWSSLSGHPNIYKYSIRGNDWNDVFITGSFGLVSHYNGSSWKHYYENELPSFYGAFYNCSVKNDIVAAAGTLGGEKALVLRGKRN